MKKRLGVIVGDNHEYGKWIRSRFNEEANRLGCDIVFIDPNSAPLHLSTSDSVIQALPEVDAVLRTETFHIPARLIEQSYIVHGTKTQHGPKQLANVVNQYTKYHLYSRMVAAGVPVPRSFFVASVDQISQSIDFFDDTYPLILKVEGIPNQRHGNGVIMVDSKKSLVSTVETMLALGYSVLVQEFIAAGSGTDTRVVVVNGKILGAIQRSGGKDEFRSNIHRGGSAMQVELTDRQREISLALAKSLDLGFIGIDLLGDPHDPVVTEYNSPCQFQGFESATGINVVEALIEMLIGSRHEAR